MQREPLSTKTVIRCPLIAKLIIWVGRFQRRMMLENNQVTQKIGSCFATINKLKFFWNNSQCPKNFKLLVFDAVIRSKLVYGLESVMIPSFLMSKLNALQLNGLRKILNMKTTYIDRANTNQEVFRRANSYKNPLGQAGKNIRQFKEYINAQQCKLLGHSASRR